MKMRGRGLLVAVVLAVSACATLQQFAALRHVDFSLERVGQGRLAGVDLSRVRSYSSLSAVEIGRITVALARNELPLEFVVDVRADNPVSNQTAATMVRLAWSLFINEKETIAGVLDTSITLPPGEPTIIPMRMRVDLMKFFDGPAQSLVDLAIAVAGLDSKPATVMLKAVPTISTPLGPMSYPSPITIMSRTVGGP